MRPGLLSFLLLAGVSCWAAAPDCAVCRRAVSGRYLAAGGKSYCSDRCFESTLARCSVCGKAFRNGVRLSNAPDKAYCRDCGSRPLCFNCRLPDRCRKLADNRQICPGCFEQAIFDRNIAETVFSEVRRRMAENLGIGTDRVIRFELAMLNSPEWQSGGSPARPQFGLYRYAFTERTVVRPDRRTLRVGRTGEIFSIHILAGIPKDKFIEVCAHELAHDWMQKNYRISDPKINEGWAEYVASEINRLFGNARLNARMADNPDPVYGDGFRFIRDYVRKHGRQGLFRYFEHLSRQP